MLRYDIVQGTPEWLKWREEDNAISATNVAVIMGVSPFKSPLKLFRQRTGLEGPDFFNPAMKRGQMLEPFARALYESITGISATACCAEHPQHPWLKSSLDGASFCETILQEFKCGKASHELALAGECPSYYRFQGATQLACVPEAREWHYLSFSPRDGFEKTPQEGIDYVLMKFQRDEILTPGLEQQIVEATTEFRNHLISRIPPVDDAFLLAEQQYARIAKTVAALAAIEKEMKERLIDAFKATGKDKIEGELVSVVEVESTGKIDLKALCAHHKISMDDDVAESFRGSGSSSIRVTVKKNKTASEAAISVAQDAAKTAAAIQSTVPASDSWEDGWD